MQIWAGLGNPGGTTRCTATTSASWPPTSSPKLHGFGPWRRSSEAWSRRPHRQHRVLLLKPQTFMNDSGEAVQQALRFYKLDLDALTVFHDELDLAPMKVKVKSRRRHRRP